MKKFVRENLYERINDIEDEDVVIPEEMEDDSDVVVKDEWEEPEEDDIPEEVDVDTSDMENDEIIAEPINDDMIIALDNELKFPEVDRALVTFKVKGKLGELSGVPMAKLKDDNYIFKVDGMMRKFNLNDINIIVDESVNSKGNKLNERMKDGYDYTYVDYLFEVATFLLLHPENVQSIFDLHDVYDEEQVKIDITNALEDHEDIYGTKAMYETGIEAEEAALKIVDNN